jgi:hypothetical protein
MTVFSVLGSLSLRHVLYGVIALLACTGSDPVAASDDPSLTSLNAELRGKILLVESVNSPAWAKDPLTFGAVTIDADTLNVTVTYGGGCRRHALQPLAETTWMESWPVQVGARIAHHANEDPCRALVTRQLHIDLSPLREAYERSYQSAHGQIRLRLAGAKDVLIYTF